jgi:hypothetical protein
MGDISKGVADTLQPAKKIYKKKEYCEVKTSGSAAGNIVK